MSWTYGGDPANNAIDATRLEIGDTTQSDPQLTDAEITYAISVEANLYGAAARCCEFLARKFAREVTRQLGSLRLEAEARSQRYMELAKELRRKALGCRVPYAGNMAVADKDSDEADSSLRQPLFTTDLMRNV